MWTIQNSRFFLSILTFDGIHYWDAHTGEHKKKLMDHTAWISSIAFSPNGKTLVSGSANGTVLLWEIEYKDNYGELLK